MRKFKDFLENRIILEADPSMGGGLPGGADPLGMGGAGGGMPALPGGGPMGGGMPPMGGPSMGGGLGAGVGPDMGGAGAGMGQSPPMKIKPLKVWDVLERILNGKPMDDKKDKKEAGQGSMNMLQNPSQQPSPQLPQPQSLFSSET